MNCIRCKQYSPGEPGFALLVKKRDVKKHRFLGILCSTCADDLCMVESLQAWLKLKGLVLWPGRVEKKIDVPWGDTPQGPKDPPS